MSNNQCYLPILKGKEGEFNALKKLDKNCKSSIAPLIEIPRAGKIQKKKIKMDKPIELHLQDVSDKIDDCWGRDFPIFIDLIIDPIARTNDGIHPLTFMFNYMWNLGLNSIPTINFSHDSQYKKALVELLGKNKKEICIRLFEAEMIFPNELAQKMNNLLKEISVSAKNIHLLLDFKELNSEKINSSAELAFNLINSHLPHIMEWKSLTVAASGYPSPSIMIKPDNLKIFPRTELKFWNQIIKDKNLKRIPSFGDYGVVHPIQFEYDVEKMKMSAKIRYTLENDWLIQKGHKISSKDSPASEQYPKLASQLITHKEFMSQDFSWGDAYIYNCAMGKEIKCGGGSKWVAVGTNHHLTFVTQQIANVLAL